MLSEQLILCCAASYENYATQICRIGPNFGPMVLYDAALRELTFNVCK
jgi:hypothetical protein